MKFIPKMGSIEATQWFKNGDHPMDNSTSIHGGLTEGKVVRYYIRPEIRGDSQCWQCGSPHYDHGWIDVPGQGHRVCPGDWIITGEAGERYPCKSDIFERTYEAAPDCQEGSPFERQVGGTHYADMAIQPALYVYLNNIGAREGDAIGYLSRWRQKGGLEDLRKAIHNIELLIELETKYGVMRTPSD